MGRRIAAAGFFFAGAQGAFASPASTGIVGGSAGVFVQLPADLVASLAGEYGGAFGSGAIVSIRVADVVAAISARFGPAHNLEVGVGALVAGLFASTESPNYTPASQSQPFWGAIVRARYGVENGLWRMAVGPDLRFHGFRPDVSVNGSTVWGVPGLTAGIALEVSRELFGSR